MMDIEDRALTGFLQNLIDEGYLGKKFTAIDVLRLIPKAASKRKSGCSKLVELIEDYDAWEALVKGEVLKDLEKQATILLQHITFYMDNVRMDTWHPEQFNVVDKGRDLWWV